MLAQAIAARGQEVDYGQQLPSAVQTHAPGYGQEYGAPRSPPAHNPYVERGPPRSPLAAPSPPLNRIGSAWQVSSAQYGQGGGAAAAPDETNTLTSAVGRAEMLIATVVSGTDISLQLFSCYSLHLTYGQDTAEPFWAAIVISLIASLLGLVSFVSRQPPGSMLQRRLTEKGETTSALLLIAVAHPELLKLLTPSRDTDSQTRIIKLDLARSVIAAVPYLPMAMNFVVAHGFGGRYWEWDNLYYSTEPNITYIELPCIEPGSGDNSTAPPPPPLPPPPPPYSPADQSGGCSYLLLISFGWTIMTIALKVIRMMLIVYIRQHTSGVQAELDAANQQLAAEQAELHGLREYYKWYNDGQDYKVESAGQQPTPAYNDASASNVASPYVDNNGGYSENHNASYY